MRCCNCNFYKSGHMSNKCNLTGDENYHSFIESQCDIIDNDYIAIIDIPQIGICKGNNMINLFEKEV